MSAQARWNTMLDYQQQKHVALQIPSQRHLLRRTCVCVAFSACALSFARLSLSRASASPRRFSASRLRAAWSTCHLRPAASALDIGHA